MGLAPASGRGRQLNRYPLPADKNMDKTRFYEPDESAIERFLKFCRRSKYPPRSPVIRPGDPADTLYLIISGSVAVSLEDEDGNELVLAYLNAGDFIGEMGLFMEPRRRDALVRSRTECELAEIKYSRLRQLMDSELQDDVAQLLFALGLQLAKRLLHTSRKVSRLAFMDVTGRVARTLLDLCNEPDAKQHPDGTQLRISRKEISRIVGCSREMAGRVLKGLEEEGLISTSGMTIIVHEAAAEAHAEA